jgi:hypothetical protein
MNGNPTGKAQPAVRECISLAALLCFGFWFFPLSNGSVSRGTIPPQNSNAADLGIPAFHNDPPEGLLPAVINPKEFGQVLTQNAYRLAAQLTAVLYQQPCYCYCDRHHGHRSLLDCYTNKHTAGCQPCLKELFYVYEQTKKGETPGQIREGIIHGDWKAVDITKYEKPLLLNSGLTLR